MNGMNLNLSELAKHFSDEAAAWLLMEEIRWPDGPICPQCGSEKAYYLGNRKTRSGQESPRRVWKCGSCRKQYSVLVGTIFERTHIPLSKWLLGIHLMSAGKNGVSAHELHRQLVITLKTAWFMAHRIRYAMEQQVTEKLSGVIEVDETYIGGFRRGVRPGRPGAGSHKTPVLTLVQRDGEARSQVMTTLTGDDIGKVLAENAEPESILMTDEFPGYIRPGQQFARHETIQHKKGEYARGNITTNRVEGYFGQLKRSINGTHHQVSRRHLPRYLAEFDYRYTNRKITDGQRTVLTIQRSEGKRLRYKDASWGPTIIVADA